MTEVHRSTDRSERLQSAERERDLTAAELQASRERLAAVIEAAPVAILEVDLDDRVRLWNPAAEAMFGWSAEETIGERVPHVQDEARAEFAELVAHVREGNVYAGFEGVRRRRDGSFVDVEISAAPIRDAGGRVTSHMAVFRDITERKRQQQDLQASRARIVQAADQERRRLERNLHDGAQQRLVSVSLALRVADARLEDDPAGTREILETAVEELALAMEELRELARGLHPAILTECGLGPAIRLLAGRAPLPVEIAGVPEERLSEAVEAAAYYVVAEALTNVAKYAQASTAAVRVALEDSRAVVEVSDDGIGGAQAAGGSGLRGLADRVEALGGRLDVQSAPGAGTRLRAEIPYP